MAVRHREFPGRRKQSSATLYEDTREAARVCGYQGGCRQEAAPRKSLSLQSPRSDDIISNTIWRSFARPKQAEGCTVASLEHSCVIWASDRFPGSGRTCTLGEKFPHRAKLILPQAFQALQLQPRRSLLTTFGVASHVGTVGNPLLP